MSQLVCEHPRHEEILKEMSKVSFIHIKEDGSREVTKPDISKVYIKNTKHETICGYCWSHEMGKVVEEHPIYIDDKDLKRFNEGKILS